MDNRFNFNSCCSCDIEFHYLSIQLSSLNSMLSCTLRLHHTIRKKLLRFLINFRTFVSCKDTWNWSILCLIKRLLSPHSTSNLGWFFNIGSSLLLKRSFLTRTTSKANTCSRSFFWNFWNLKLLLGIWSLIAWDQNTEPILGIFISTIISEQGIIYCFVKDHIIIVILKGR